MVLVATQVKRRRGTTAENDAFTGAEGEITVDTTTHEIRVHDGSTVGGHIIPTKDYSYSKTESDDLLSNKANVALDNLTSTGKENVIAYALANIQNTDNAKIGYVYHGYINFGTISAPAGGKWLVLYTLQVKNNDGVAYRFSSDMVSPVGSIVAGGTYIINARSGYTNEALLLKIE